ncbi:unnamed protein product, partial [Ilex paraguariensis]
GKAIEVGKQGASIRSNNIGCRRGRRGMGALAGVRSDVGIGSVGLALGVLGWSMGTRHGCWCTRLAL